MLRRLKAIYLIPVFILLMVGAAVGLHFGVISPQIQKTKTAQAEWTQAKSDCKAVEGEYQNHLDAQVKHSTDLLNNFYTFHLIQNRMPNIYNMQKLYAGKQKQGLIEWYRIMGSGAMIKELNRWAKGYHVQNVPKFEFKGDLPFEDGLPAVNMVEVEFGAQTFTARGFQDLLDQVVRRSGYSYFPLLIEPEGGKVSIAVLRNDRRHHPSKPLLQMKYTCKGYFMTRGWDPNDFTSESEDIRKAKERIANPPQAEKARTEWVPNGPPPNILLFIAPKDVTLD
ncbi:MAG: hypothetical protein ACYC7E_22320 [Armatimonadota bacterium]